MKNLICERVLGAVLALTFPAEFIGVMGMESDAGAWAVWLCVACAALQLTAMAVVKVVWGRGDPRSR